MTTKMHTDITFGAPATAAVLDAPLGQLDAALADVELQLGDFVITGGLAGTSASLIVAQPSIRAFVLNAYVTALAQNLTMIASNDNYVDIDNAGAYHITSVANGAAEPVIFANSIRLYKAVAGVAAVTSVVDLRQLGVVFPNNVFVKGPGPWADAKAWGAGRATSTDDTALLASAYNAVANGGVLYMSPGAYPGALSINQNNRFRLLAFGATLQPLANTTGLFVSQGLGGTAPGCVIDGLVIDGQSRAGVIGCNIQDTDRTALINGRIVNCVTGLLFSSFAAAKWCENHSIDNVFIYNCGTGISFVVTAGTGSFGECDFRAVGVTSCTLGISVGTNANIYRSFWRNVVVWLTGTQKGMFIDGNVTNAVLNIAFEALSGTPNGLDIGTNTVGAPLAELLLSFTGTFNYQVNDPFSKLPVWRIGTRQFWTSGNQSTFESWQAGDTNPRVQVFNQFAAGGGIKFGSGAIAGDTTLYRTAANFLKTDGDFATVRGVQAGLAGKLAFTAPDAGGGATFGGDTTIYRAGAAFLKTDGDFATGGKVQIATALQHQGTTLGLFNTTPVVKGTVAGGRGAVGLGNLLAALAAYGLVTDSTVIRQTPAFNAAPTPDFTLGEIYEMAALTGAVNVGNPVNAAVGQKAKLYWKQDGTGGRAVAYTGTNWRSVGIAAQVTTLNTYTIDEVECVDGTVWRVARLVTGQTV